MIMSSELKESDLVTQPANSLASFSEGLKGDSQRVYAPSLPFWSPSDMFTIFSLTLEMLQWKSSSGFAHQKSYSSYLSQQKAKKKKSFVLFALFSPWINRLKKAKRHSKFRTSKTLRLRFIDFFVFL